LTSWHARPLPERCGAGVDQSRGRHELRYNASMVSDSDREYMRRLGEAKANSRAAAVAAHLALAPIDRLRRSFALSAAMRATANLDRRDDRPEEFYARARALGLCDR
jgi:hypothetical protein